MSTTFDQICKDLKLSKAESDRVRRHEVVHLSASSATPGPLTDRELSAGFAFLIDNISQDELETIFLENSDKEEADPSIQQPIGRSTSSDDGMALDFSSMQLLPEKSQKEIIKAYTNNKPGDDLNLSNEERKLFNNLGSKNTSIEQVEEVLKKVLQQRLHDYQTKGLKGILPYVRKGGKQYLPGDELEQKTSQLAVSKKHSPEFVDYILNYPDRKPEMGRVQESYAWINFNIDDKPTISLVHKLCYKTETMGKPTTMMLHRHFYVSRGHNSVQAVGGGMPIEEDGKTFVMLDSRTSTDQVSGFGGSAKRALGSKIMGGRIADNLVRYRKVLEQK